MEPRGLTRRTWWLVCVVLVGLGLAQSAYLLARLFASYAPTGPGALDLCSILFAAACDHALADERSWLLSLPIAGWGLVYFASLGALLALARFMRQAFEAEALLAGALATLAGVAIGLELTVGGWLAGVPVCPLCLLVHATSVVLLVAIRKATPQPVSQQMRMLRAGWAWLLASGTGASEPARWRVVGFGSVALVALVAYQWVYVEIALRRPPGERPPDRAAVIAAYRAAPPVDLPLSEEDPHLGPLTAPVRLVVFESFRCPSCRRLAGALPALRRRFRDRLVVVYKHYPLSTQCNERLTRDMQPGACEIAWAAEAARRQARFWPFHDALLAAGTAPSRETIATLVRRLNLDPARFEADRQSAATRERVTADIALGNQLKIPGTPAVFLDGRLVPAARPEVLKILIGLAIDGAAQDRRRAVVPATSSARPGEEGRPTEGG